MNDVFPGLLVLKHGFICAVKKPLNIKISIWIYQANVKLIYFASPSWNHVNLDFFLHYIKTVKTICWSSLSYNEVVVTMAFGT